MKLAILMSHAIQYQVPLLRKIAARRDFEMRAYFCWDYGVKKTYDVEFGREVRWDIPLLEGYPHTFLKNYSPRPSSDFWGQLNFGIVRELIRHRYDAILLFGWNSFANWLVFLFAPLVGTRIILHSESPLKQELVKSPWKLALKRVVLTFLFRRVSAFLYIGQENRKFYLHYGVPETKLFFAPYAVDDERFLREAKMHRGKRDEFRRDLGIPGDAITFLFVGKLIEKKRPFDLLRAFERAVSIVSRAHKKIALVFVGDGALRKTLEQYAHAHHMRNVQFAGFKNQTELSRYYAAVDAFVLPSGLGETWGLVVNEALCFGLPVIVSDMVGCGGDLVRDNENGYVFPLGDIEKLAHNIASLAESGERREVFGAMSSEIIKGYTQDKDVEAIAKALFS